MSQEFKVDNLSISFGGLKAVSQFHLKLGPKSLHGLIGPNGAGKTTVFNLITGVYRPNTGSILLGDRDLVGLRPFEIAKAGVARTFQNIRLLPEVTVLDNVMLSYHHKVKYGYFDTLMRTKKFLDTEKKWKEDAMKLLAILRLDSKADMYAKNLPYGYQKRLEISRALALEPKVLFLDEPAAGLHSQEKAELMDVIRKIREEFNVAIVVIEHDMKLVMGICERITVLDHGEIIAEGTPQEIQNNSKVIQAYLGVE